MSACADCIKGSLDEGTPKGQDSTIAGVPCYITKPEAEAANGCAVILATDIFGYHLINARLIADAYADAGYICVVPDYFKGEPMDMKLLEHFESLPTQNFFGKITTGLQLVLQVINLVGLVLTHLAAVTAIPQPARQLACAHTAHSILPWPPSAYAYAHAASPVGWCSWQPLMQPSACLICLIRMTHTCCYCTLLPSHCCQGRWFQRHPFSHGVDVVTQVAAALKQECGAKKVGLQG